MKSYFVIKKFQYKVGWLYYAGDKPTVNFSENITRAILYVSHEGAEEIMKKMSGSYKNHIFSIEKIYINR